MEAKKLGFGLMRLPIKDENDVTTIDMEHLHILIRPMCITWEKVR